MSEHSSPDYIIVVHAAIQEPIKEKDTIESHNGTERMGMEIALSPTIPHDGPRKQLLP